MSYSYWLPDEKGTKQEYKTDNNSVVIVGANGAGKSKLGAWIEKNGFDKVHRIGAQRNLNFNENISLKNYSQAEDLVFWGSVEESTKRDKMKRWNYGKGYTTKLLDDFENVLAALLALKNNENERFVKECRQAEKEERKHPNVPVTVIDKLNLVWNGVFPQRQLEIEDSKFYAVFSGSNKKYPANQMSDGERSVLYLASQVLCVPPNKILIIDEPETHLHRSIMNRLWKTLENMRNDCLFIYITHDTDFAASHMSADKFWITDFDGNNWTFENIKGYELPEDLLFNILGSRKKVLFVEGEKNSYDTKLYSMLYPEYYVIPCGSCTQVIQRTKAFNSVEKLHRCQVYGLIDRDFRPSAEIESYKKYNIFVINVAEVENLFVIEEIIKLMAVYMQKDADDVFSKVSKYVIDQRFAKQINGQLRKKAISEIKYKLTVIDIEGKNLDDIKIFTKKITDKISCDAIIDECEKYFTLVLNNREYKEVIKVFNEKGIVKSVGHFLGIQDDNYCNMVLSLTNSEKKEEFIKAFAGYLPSEIPRGNAG